MSSEFNFIGLIAVVLCLLAFSLSVYSFKSGIKFWRSCRFFLTGLSISFLLVAFECFQFSHTTLDEGVRRTLFINRIALGVIVVSVLTIPLAKKYDRY